MKRQLLLLAALLLFARSGFAQGTNGTLVCAFDGELDIHATDDRTSPIIGTLPCGDRVLVFDRTFEVTHIQTANGLQGFITDLTIGQWAIEPDAQQDDLLKAVPAAMPVPGAVPAPSAASDFRRFEIGVLGSYVRLDGSNLAGGELSFVVNLSDRWGIVSAVDVHEDVDLSSLRYTTYRAGVRATPLRTSRVTGFAETTAGGSHVRLPVVDDVNGFAFTAGGGFDLHFQPWIAWRMAKVEYWLIRASGSTSDGIRLGTGVVFRFGDK